MKQFLQRKQYARKTIVAKTIDKHSEASSSFLGQMKRLPWTESESVEDAVPLGYDDVPTYNMVDYTLTQLDHIIQARLLSRMHHVDYLYTQLKSESDSKKINLRSTIRDIETGSEYMYYMVSTMTILSEYHLLYQQMYTSSFLKSAESQQSLNLIRDRIQKLIMYYISVAKHFVKIDYQEPSNDKWVCPSCQSPHMQCVNSFENVYVCQECYTEHYIHIDQPAFKDIDRINFNAKHTYSTSGHIRDAVQCFQGLQTINPQKLEIIMDILQRQCQFYGLSKDAHDPKCITKQDIYSFLEQERGHDSSKNMSDHYKDVNLLHRMLTGIPCPDISDYLSQLYADFEIQEQAYKSMDHGDRKNSLNVYYKLYKLLQRQNAPYTVKDFFFLKTQEVLDQHDEETKKVWAQLGWPWLETL